MKKSLKVTGSLLSLALSIGACSPLIVNAKTLDNDTSKGKVVYTESKSYITSQEEKTLREQFKNDGLEQENIENVIRKLKNGETLDAENPVMIEKVPKTFFEFDIKELGVKSKMHKFEDGSYIKLTSTPSSDEYVSRSVINTNYSKEYSDEYVEARYGTIRAGFIATFSNYRGGGSTIYSAHTTSGWGPGTWSYGSPTIVRSKQSGSSPAFASASLTQTTTAAWMTKTNGFSLELKVYESSYTMELKKH